MSSSSMEERSGNYTDGKTMLPILVNRDNAIRRNYFSKLGIVGATEKDGRQLSQSNNEQHRQQHVHPLCALRDAHVEPLSSVVVDTSNSSSPVTSSASVGTRTRKVEVARPRLVSFDESVQVVPIPMRKDYSRRVRARLYGDGANAITQNAQRNIVEYAAEGWVWWQCMEEDQMYRCCKSGELIHPVHVERHGGPIRGYHMSEHQG